MLLHVVNKDDYIVVFPIMGLILLLIKAIFPTYMREDTVVNGHDSNT